jgi:hypothetical protein
MARPGRNDLCSCGSGKKFKRCHGQQTDSTRASRTLLIAVGVAVVAALAVGLASVTGDRSAGAVRVWDPAHGHFHDANGVQVP